MRYAGGSASSTSRAAVRAARCMLVYSRLCACKACCCLPTNGGRQRCDALVCERMQACLRLVYYYSVVYVTRLVAPAACSTSTEWLPLLSTGHCSGITRSPGGASGVVLLASAKEGAVAQTTAGGSRSAVSQCSRKGGVMVVQAGAIAVESGLPQEQGAGRQACYHRSASLQPAHQYGLLSAARSASHKSFHIYKPTSQRKTLLASTGGHRQAEAVGATPLCSRGPLLRCIRKIETTTFCMATRAMSRRASVCCGGPCPSGPATKPAPSSSYGRGWRPRTA